jgi:hypothetical protein
MRVWGPGPVIADAVPKFNRYRRAGLQEEEGIAGFFVLSMRG